MPEIARRCRKPLSISLRRAVILLLILLFRHPESSDIKGLILISCPLARDGRGRFARGHSGNPRGRPKGIPNPRRRIPDLAARPLAPAALSALIGKKPHLLRALAAQLLPPPIAARDPAERLGIDLLSLRTPEEARHCLSSVFAALSRGEIAPAEAGRIARRVRTRRRAVCRLARVQRRLAAITDPLRPSSGSE